MIHNYLVGSDVEFFVQDKATSEIVSAEGLIPGTKQSPHRFDELNTWFATQLDNVLAEGNIPPASSATQFAASLARLRSHIDSILPSGLVTTARAAAVLDPRHLQTENAKRFACDPSFSCWTGDVEVVDSSAMPNLRTAGFHIHVGYENRNPMQDMEIARVLDLYLGVPAALVDDSQEATLRRTFGYGRAGSMRHQFHGVEYRTLSSAMAATPARVQWAYEATAAAMSAVNKGLGAQVRTIGGAIQLAVNGNKSIAGKLVADFGLKVPA